VRPKAQRRTTAWRPLILVRPYTTTPDPAASNWVKMSGMNDFAEHLARLEEQRHDGQITDEEYRDLRAQLLENRDQGSRRLIVGAVLVIVLVLVVVIVATA